MLAALDLDGTISAFPAQMAAVMSSLRAAGHTVYVVTGADSATATLEQVTGAKASFLDSLGCGQCYDGLAVIPPPHADNKAAYLESVGADLLIDNSKDNAKAAASVCPVLVPWQTRESADDSVVAKGERDIVDALIVKSVGERQYTLGLAYPALKPDGTRSTDGHRDFIGPEALELAAWRYMAKSRVVGVGLPTSGVNGHFTAEFDGTGTVVESYIYRGPDWLSTDIDGGEQVIKAGDWLAGVVWDDAAWQAIKLGLARGFSPEGAGSRSTPSAARLLELR